MDGLRSGTEGKNATTVPIKDAIMKELAGGEPVISIQQLVVKGQLDRPSGLYKCVYAK